MADPTPRTAATARERVTVDYAMVERAIRTALPADMVFAYMPHGDPFAAWAGHLFANLTALAAAEAPGRVAALTAALRSIAAREPAPATPGCTCDPDSATDDDGNLVMCDLHEPMLRHLSWETLASLVIDYQAFTRHALAVADAALAAPAPTPSEPVGRVDGWMTEKCSNCPHVKGRHLPDWGCMVPDASGPCGCTLSFTPATRDE